MASNLIVSSGGIADKGRGALHGAAPCTRLNTTAIIPTRLANFECFVETYQVEMVLGRGTVRVMKGEQYIATYNTKSFMARTRDMSNGNAHSEMGGGGGIWFARRGAPRDGTSTAGNMQGKDTGKKSMVGYVLFLYTQPVSGRIYIYTYESIENRS